MVPPVLPPPSAQAAGVSIHWWPARAAPCVMFQTGDNVQRGPPLRVSEFFGTRALIPFLNAKLARYRDDVSHARSGSSSNIGMSNLSPNRPTSEALSTTASGSGLGGAAVPTRSSSTTKGTRLVPNRPGDASGSRLPPGVSPEWGIEPEIIIQHRDGGTVTEIPPPYVDAAAGTSYNTASGSGNGSDNPPRT